MAFASRLLKNPYPAMLSDRGGRGRQSCMDVRCTQACPALSEAGFLRPGAGCPGPGAPHHCHDGARRRMQPAALLRPPTGAPALRHRTCRGSDRAPGVFLFARSVVLRERTSAGFIFASVIPRPRPVNPSRRRWLAACGDPPASRRGPRRGLHSRPPTRQSVSHRRCGSRRSGSHGFRCRESSCARSSR
jgi:hypothetical protein